MLDTKAALSSKICIIIIINTSNHELRDHRYTQGATKVKKKNLPKSNKENKCEGESTERHTRSNETENLNAYIMPFFLQHTQTVSQFTEIIMVTYVI